MEDPASEMISKEPSNRKVATTSKIKDMIDRTTMTTLTVNPVDRSVNVRADQTLNFNLESYRVIHPDEPVDEEPDECFGIRFVEPGTREGDENDDGNVEVYSMQSEMECFDKAMDEGIEIVKARHENPEEEDVDGKTTKFSTLAEIEAEFMKSKTKDHIIKKLEALNEKKIWQEKLGSFAAKSINANIVIADDVTFESYLKDIYQHGIQTLPKVMVNTIKENVANFVNDCTKPFNDIYNEALAMAPTLSEEELYTMREKVVASMPICTHNTEPVRESAPMKSDKCIQTNATTCENSMQTMAGLGTFEDNDFDAIVEHNAEVVYEPEDYDESDEEPGFMSKKNEELLRARLEEEIIRQERITEDVKKSLDPNVGLELKEIYSDHKKILDSINKAMDSNIQIYNDSFAQHRDRTLPPPEVLTFKNRGRAYKFLTTYSWDSASKEKRMKKHQQFYIYLPPPTMLNSTRKRVTSESETEIAAQGPVKCPRISSEILLNKTGEVNNDDKHNGMN